MIDEGEFKRDQRISLAVARVIAGVRHGGDVRPIDVPEMHNRSDPAVELITVDDVGTLAIEHTRIEAFEGQRTDNARVAGYLDALPSRVMGMLPPNMNLVVALDVGAVDGIKDAESVLQALATWVVNTAPVLDVAPGRAPRHMAAAGPPDLPIRARLFASHRDEGETMAQLQVSRAYPQGLEALHRKRVGRALLDKGPKLASAADEHDGEDVLVLECNDHVLSNAYATLQALRDAVEVDLLPAPRWIVLWEQTAGWTAALILRQSGAWVDDLRLIHVEPMT